MIDSKVEISKKFRQFTNAIEIEQRKKIYENISNNVSREIHDLYDIHAFDIYASFPINFGSFLIYKGQEKVDDVKSNIIKSVAYFVPTLFSSDNCQFCLSLKVLSFADFKLTYDGSIRLFLDNMHLCDEDFHVLPTSFAHASLK